MADGTKIEWTDATVNAINGCTVLSPGCKHCYAMKQAHRVEARRGLTVQSAGGMVWTGDVRFNEKALVQPLSWRRPRKIFWNAHGDIFHEKVPDLWIDRCFAVMALTPHHIHQVLTKRSDRMREYLTTPGRHPMILSEAVEIGGKTITLRAGENDWPWPFPNVWLGVSVEDRTRMLERAADLKETPAAVRWWSAEPLLGDLGEIPPQLMPDWIVLGGESGPKARPMHPDWARSVRDQCAAAGVPFHFKQWGAWAPGGTWPHLQDPAIANERGFGTILPDGSYRGRGFFPKEARNAADVWRVGKKAAGRLLDGVEHNGFPPVVILRQSGGQIAEVISA